MTGDERSKLEALWRRWFNRAWRLLDAIEDVNPARAKEIVEGWETSPESNEIVRLRARVAELEKALMVEADGHSVAGRANDSFRATSWVTAPEVARVQGDVKGEGR